jgi:hypothetical protein
LLISSSKKYEKNEKKEILLLKIEGINLKPKFTILNNLTELKDLKNLFETRGP